jgi:hypothetical protein
MNDNGSSRQYLALVGDIKQSRSLANRPLVQQRLEAVCERLNRHAHTLDLLSPMTVTLGDEFQALFGSAGALWPVVFAVEAALQGDEDSPVSLRFGIGLGELSTSVNPAAAIGMDGPAFYRARDAIDSLKQDDRCYRVCGLLRRENMVRHALDYISHQRRSWRPNRVQVFSDLLRGKKPAEIAQRIGISDRAVYKNIRHGDLESLAGFLVSLSGLIDEQLKGDA